MKNIILKGKMSDVIKALRLLRSLKWRLTR